MNLEQSNAPSGRLFDVEDALPENNFTFRVSVNKDLFRGRCAAEHIRQEMRPRGSSLDEVSD